MFKISPVLVRRFVIFMTHVLRVLFTRTKIIGLENIPEEGPVLLTPNHISNLDPFLLAAYAPFDRGQILSHDPQRYHWPWNHIIGAMATLNVPENSGIGGMKPVREFLANDGVLCVFPEGGIWEKDIRDMRQGTAYLAASTGAKIVPIAISGAYNLFGRIMKFQRPRIIMEFGEPIDPADYIDRSQSRRIPRDKLAELSQVLAQTIYDMLTPEDQRLYDRFAGQKYCMQLDFLPVEKFTLEPVSEFPVLAELLNKPNLAAPFIAGARPLTTKRGFYMPAYTFKRALTAMEIVLNGPQEGYLEERWGKEKASRLYEELQIFTQIVDQAVLADVLIRLNTYEVD